MAVNKLGMWLYVGNESDASDEATRRSGLEGEEGRQQRVKLLS